MKDTHSAFDKNEFYETARSSGTILLPEQALAERKQTTILFDY